MKHGCSELKKRVTSLLRRQQVTMIIFKRPITLDTSCIMSCPVWRCCSEVSLSDLIVISWEVQASMCALSTGILVVKEWVISVYNLWAARGEGAFSSFIIWLDSACTACLIWLRVSAVTVERVLMRDKAVGSAQRAWIRCQVVQVSGASVLRLCIKIWRV